MIVGYYYSDRLSRKLLASRDPSRYLHGASRTAVFLPLPLFTPLPLFYPGTDQGGIPSEIWVLGHEGCLRKVNASRDLHESFTGKGYFFCWTLGALLTPFSPKHVLPSRNPSRNLHGASRMQGKVQCQFSFTGTFNEASRIFTDACFLKQRGKTRGKARKNSFLESTWFAL